MESIPNRAAGERWHVGRNPGEVVDENGLRVAYVCGQAEDDTLMIAAAPEMKDALGADASGRSFALLLNITAEYLEDRDQLHIARCLRAKALQVESALSAATIPDLSGLNGPHL